MLIKRAFSHQKLLCHPVPSKKGNILPPSLAFKMGKRKPTHLFFSNNHYRAKILTEFPVMPETFPKKKKSRIPFFFTRRISVTQKPQGHSRNVDTFFLVPPGRQFGIQNPQHIPATAGWVLEAWGDWGLLPEMGRITECPWFASCYLPASAREGNIF